MRISVVQFFPEFDQPARNADRMATYLAESDADLLVFPEAALSGYCFREEAEARAAARSVDSSEIQGIAAAAQQNGRYAVVGFAEIADGNLYNSAVLLGPEGVVGTYRKTHIPFLGLDRYVAAGEGLPVFLTELGKIGVLICFDIRFPEAARTLALRGADVICVPTNWPESAENSSDFVCPTRSIENHVFIAASNRVGAENGFSFIGKSKIIAPGGKLLAAADHREEAVITAEADLTKARNKHIVKIPGEYELPLFEARRPDLYETIVEEQVQV